MLKSYAKELEQKEAVRLKNWLDGSSDFPWNCLHCKYQNRANLKICRACCVPKGSAGKAKTEKSVVKSSAESAVDVMSHAEVRETVSEMDFLAEVVHSDVESDGLLGAG